MVRHLESENPENENHESKDPPRDRSFMHVMLPLLVTGITHECLRIEDKNWLVKQKLNIKVKIGANSYEHVLRTLDDSLSGPDDLLTSSLLKHCLTSSSFNIYKSRYHVHEKKWQKLEMW